MSPALKRRRVAVIGAGIAGAACARRLDDAGYEVHLFEKSRGVGGRMATRRSDWADAEGTVRTASFDHGAPAFRARSPAFRRFVEQAAAHGWLERWTPSMAPGSAPNHEQDALWVPSPDMPSLCRRLLGPLPVALGHAVDALRRDVQGWGLFGQGDRLGRDFDRVVLAMPAPQAADLLQPLRADWAQQARRVPMLPCWTLMGVAAPGETRPGWDAGAPPDGPLAWIARNGCKPGRDRSTGFEHWVVHADADWSRRHLESPDTEVRDALQQALADRLGRPVRWHHAMVHRWRYASVQPQGRVLSGRCWWDAAAGLGVCGDFLGGSGVEGAWLSARALADTIAVTDSMQASLQAPPARARFPAPAGLEMATAR